MLESFHGDFEIEGEGICPFAETLYHNSISMDISVSIFTTRCDQMRRISGFVQSEKQEKFLMNVPSTWQTPASFEIFKDELKRLSKFLTHLSGKQFSIETMINELKKKKYDIPKSKKGKRIAVMGASITDADAGFCKLLTKKSANITFDASEQGEIAQPDIDFKQLNKHPFKELTNASFRNMPDIAKRPNIQFYDKANEIIRMRKIQGIILRIYPWCDLWHAEVQRIKEYFGLPVLELTVDINVEPEKDKRLQTRLNAFLEMI